MAKKLRQIIKIDEGLCNGCGLCVTACAEGALQIIDGKAKLVSESYCDGLGTCLGECPQGAISFEAREAEEFDEEAAAGHTHHSHTHDHAAHDASAKHEGFVCPSAQIIDRTHEACHEVSTETGSVGSELRQWPVKLYLVNPQASYFENSNLLVAADCVPFVYGGFHQDFLKGKTLVTGCPKFDEVELYIDKLSEILRLNDVHGVTVLHMEVPCCSGLLRLVEQAVKKSGKSVPVESVVVTLTGEVKSRT